MIPSIAPLAIAIKFSVYLVIFLAVFCVSVTRDFMVTEILLLPRVAALEVQKAPAPLNGIIKEGGNAIPNRSVPIKRKRRGGPSSSGQGSLTRPPSVSGRPRASASRPWVPPPSLPSLRPETNTAATVESADGASGAASDRQWSLGNGGPLRNQPPPSGGSGGDSFQQISFQELERLAGGTLQESRGMSAKEPDHVQLNFSGTIPVECADWWASSQTGLEQRTFRFKVWVPTKCKEIALGLRRPQALIKKQDFFQGLRYSEKLVDKVIMRDSDMNIDHQFYSAKYRPPEKTSVVSGDFRLPEEIALSRECLPTKVVQLDPGAVPLQEATEACNCDADSVGLTDVFGQDSTKNIFTNMSRIAKAAYKSAPQKEIFDSTHALCSKAPESLPCVKAKRKIEEYFQEEYSQKISKKVIMALLKEAGFDDVSLFKWDSKGSFKFLSFNVKEKATKDPSCNTSASLKEGDPKKASPGKFSEDLEVSYRFFVMKVSPQGLKEVSPIRIDIKLRDLLALKIDTAFDLETQQASAKLKVKVPFRLISAKHGSIQFSLGAQTAIGASEGKRPSPAVTGMVSISQPLPDFGPSRMFPKPPQGQRPLTRPPIRN